jgi:predicted lipoprotein with Yx(FWY)xxD motif
MGRIDQRRDLALGTAALAIALCLPGAEAGARSAAASARSTAAAAAPGFGPDAPARLQVTDDGPVLVTPAGMALYFHNPDSSRPGHSLCTNAVTRAYPDVLGGFGDVPVPRPQETKSCIDKNPPLLADAQARPHGDWSIIERPEGTKQWAYDGRPLYTSARDKQPGERNGEVMQYSSRFSLAVAKDTLGLPPGIESTTLEENQVLAAAKGHRLLFTPKGKRPRICEGCEGPLEPMTAAALARVGGDWSLVDAGRGRVQYAFKGKPLYVPQPGVTIWDVERLGGWEPVVLHEGARKPAEIGEQLTLGGRVYTTTAGKALYVFNCFSGSGPGSGVTCNDPGEPARYWTALCSDAKTCAERWRPYVAAPGAKPSGPWTITDVPDPMFSDPDGVTYSSDLPRVKAWAYRGHPVYTYFLDELPGDIRGHMIRWTGNRSYMTALRVPGRTVPGGEY